MHVISGDTKCDLQHRSGHQKSHLTLKSDLRYALEHSYFAIVLFHQPKRVSAASEHLLTLLNLSLEHDTPMPADFSIGQNVSVASMYFWSANAAKGARGSHSN